MRLVRNSDLTYSALRLELFPMFSIGKSYQFWNQIRKEAWNTMRLWKLQSTNSAFFVVTTTTLPHAHTHSFFSSSLHIFPRSFQAKKYMTVQQKMHYVWTATSLIQLFFRLTVNLPKASLVGKFRLYAFQYLSSHLSHIHPHILEFKPISIVKIQCRYKKVNSCTRVMS